MHRLGVRWGRGDAYERTESSEMQRLGRLARLGVGVGLAAGGLVAPSALASTSAPPPVVVLLDGHLPPAGTPVGLTPQWVVSSLSAQGIPATLVSAAQVKPSEVIVNPYGAAFPSATAITSALAHGARWVNLASVPFLEPDGTEADTMPAQFGIFAPLTPSSWFTGSAATELGRAAIPDFPPNSQAHTGWTIHASRPELERPLVDYHDAVGTDGGPAVVDVLAPYRVVAAGYEGDTSPLSPDATGSAAALASLVRLAQTSPPRISSVVVSHTGSGLTITAQGSGHLTGIGASSAPAPWTPSHPTVVTDTIRLYSQGQLVDLRSLVTNPATVTVLGRQLLVNGKPFVVQGVEEETDQFAPGTAPLDQASIMRADFQRMTADGVNALRGYSYQSDWWINTSARYGLFYMDAMPFGTLSQSAIDAALPWAQFIGARDEGSANLLMYSVGNETQDSGFGTPSVVQQQLAELAAAIRSTDHRTHPVTYAASEDEPWVLGSLPFLDIYSYNNYGATYPVAQDSTGFLVAQEIAQQIAGNRPFLLTEWGVNATPNGQARLVAGSDVPALGQVQASSVYRKWTTLRSAGAIGGYYFEWSDKLVTGFPLPVPFYDQTLGSVVYPPGSGYHPANEEDFWGLNDVYRNPRPALAGLAYAYTGKGPAPLPIPGP